MKKIIRHTLSALQRNERRELRLLVITQVLLGLAEIGSLACLLLVVQLYTGAGSPPAWAPGWLTADGYSIPLLLVLLFLAKNTIAYLAARRQFGFVYTVASRLSGKALRRYLSGSYTAYADVDSSVRIREISHQPVEFSHYVLAGLMQLITESAMAAMAIIAIAVFNVKIFMVLLLVLLPPVVLTAWLARRKLKTARRQVKLTAEKATQYLQEALEGYVESNIYRTEDFFLGRYNSSQGRLNRYLSSLQVVQAMPARFMEVFAVLGLLALILVNRHLPGQASGLLNLGAFVAAAYKIIPGISRIAGISAQMKLYAFSIPAVDDDREGTPETYNTIRDHIRSVRFRDVSFAHNGRPVLNGFNTEIRAGELAGLSAASGKGKTTLLHLLLGFLEPDTGSIAINDIPADAAGRHRYRYDTAYVKQQQFLIHDTIAANISLSDAPYDPVKMNAAIRHSGLEAVVDNLPGGLDYLVADGGKNISGGQRQRIGIARALYRDAHLILLDEPFNELDADAEEDMLRLFREIAGEGRIVILVTHNKSSLDGCHKTITLHA